VERRVEGLRLECRRTKRQLRSPSRELEEGQEELEKAILKFKVYSILIGVH